MVLLSTKLKRPSQTITNTTSNSAFYPTVINASTTGTYSEYVLSTVSMNPSTGVLTSQAHTATNTTNQLTLGSTNTTTINAPAPAASTTLTLPITSDTILGRSTTDTLINKTLTDSSNNSTARALFVGSGANTVSTYASALGVTGQVLTMATATTAAFSYHPSVTGMGLNYYDVASGSYALTLSSAYCQYIHGTSAGITITMPGGTGANSTGAYQSVVFWIINNSTQTVTVNSSGANLIKAVLSLTAYWFVQQITGTSTAATVWTYIGPVTNAL